MSRRVPLRGLLFPISSAVLCEILSVLCGLRVQKLATTAEDAEDFAETAEKN
jgi:hypothetical protein